MTNIKALGLVVLDKRISKVFLLPGNSMFSPSDLVMQRTVPILTNVKGSYIRIIPAKFGKNPASSLEEMAFEVIVDKGR